MKVVSLPTWRKSIVLTLFVYIPALILLLRLLCDRKPKVHVKVMSLFNPALHSINGKEEALIAPDDPLLLSYIRLKYLIPPSKDPVVLSNKDVHYGKSNEQQEMYRFIFSLLENKSNGFFIECGAHDGEFFSNTLPLEMHHNWTGLLVETDPYPLQGLLKRNRHSWISPSCLSPKKYPVKIKFKQHKTITGWSFMGGWGTLKGNESDYKIHEAQCFPLYSLLTAINVTTVDYFSLDIEGAELFVLKTIPWSKILIKALSIEVDAKDLRATKEIKDFMTSVGYNYVTTITNSFSHDHVYLHNSIESKKLTSRPIIPSPSVHTVGEQKFIKNYLTGR